MNHINLIQITNYKSYIFAAKPSNLKFNIFKLKIRIWLFWPISRLKKPLACWGSRYAPAKVASSSAFVCMYVVLSSTYTVCFALCFQKRHHRAIVHNLILLTTCSEFQYKGAHSLTVDFELNKISLQRVYICFG